MHENTKKTSFLLKCAELMELNRPICRRSANAMNRMATSVADLTVIYVPSVQRRASVALPKDRRLSGMVVDAVMGASVGVVIETST
jgi:hypothetical protein